MTAKTLRATKFEVSIAYKPIIGSEVSSSTPSQLFHNGRSRKRFGAFWSTLYIYAYICWIYLRIYLLDLEKVVLDAAGSSGSICCTFGYMYLIVIAIVNVTVPYLQQRDRQRMTMTV